MMRFTIYTHTCITHEEPCMHHYVREVPACTHNLEEHQLHVMMLI